MSISSSSSPEVYLGEIFQISSSKRVLQSHWTNRGVPFYRAREIVKLAQAGHVDNELFISEELFDELSRKFGAPRQGDLMVSAVGTLGACYEVGPNDRFYFKDASVLRLEPKTELCSRFFWHAFQTFALRQQILSTSGSTVGTLTISRANELKVPLPPLDEQKRIAAILDKADQLRQKRRQAIALLDSLTQSIFLEMFGDPVSNPKGWETQRFGACVTIDAPLVDPRLPQYQNLLHYGPDRIEKDSGRLMLAQTASEDNLISKKFLCDGRHILYSKIRPYLNKVAISPGECLCSADMYPIEPKDSVVDKFYLWFILRTKLFLSYADSCSGRANIPKINREQLLNFKMPCPDLVSQREFRSRIENLEENRAKQELSLSKMEQTFSSLQHRAFSGQL